MFDDGSGTPVVATSYDTPEEAADAGRRCETDELRFVQVARHAGPTDLTMLAAELRQRRDDHAALTDGRRHVGLITRWDTTSGFATSSEGKSWFVSCYDLPDGYDRLPLNTRISWSGSPNCLPGKKYPQARSIQLET